ncbi:DUF2997 domain-containing protein [Patescibacteria group bacterium]|nr:DUF2997 domain-containing protein [Patescibacteria group bacterium]
MTKQIIITLDKRTMRTTVEVKGAMGAECLSFSQNVENALGKPGERKLKDEFHAPAEAQLTNKLST